MDGFAMRLGDLVGAFVVAAVGFFGYGEEFDTWVDGRGRRSLCAEDK